MWETVPEVAGAEDGPYHAGVPLPSLLSYWRAVERSTQAYLTTLTAAELRRTVPVTGRAGTRQLAVAGLLEHFMLHEVRHTAQLTLLLRAQGITPPALDLLGYLPSA